MFMDLFSTLQLLHEAVMLVLVTTIYGRWRGTITNAMCIECEVRKRVGGYVHKEQLEFYTFEGEDITSDNEEY